MFFVCVYIATAKLNYIYMHSFCTIFSITQLFYETNHFSYKTSVIPRGLPPVLLPIW